MRGNPASAKAPAGKIFRVARAFPEYSTGSRRFLAHAAGIPRQFVPRVPAGHCHSVDMLRGLRDLAGSGSLPDGAKVLALASGNSSWSVFALRYHG